MSSTGKLKTVSILGCGWFGLAFAKKLIELNYKVKGSTTTPDKLPFLAANGIEPFLINFTLNVISADLAFFDTDVLFICIPPKRNSTELNDYPNKIKAILESSKSYNPKIVLISSTSVYKDENKIVNELINPNPDTDSGKVVLGAELIVQKFAPLNYTIIRFAGLFGPDRNPGRFFAGKKDIPNGLAPVNLIHQLDAVGLACKLLETEAFGKIFNACNPDHPSKQDFYTAAAKASALIKPEFILEKQEWKIIESINVPKFLGYKFLFDLKLSQQTQ